MVRESDAGHEGIPNNINGSHSFGRWWGAAILPLFLAQMAFAGSSGIVVLDQGKEHAITADDAAKLGGEKPLYLLQIGDTLNAIYRVATVRENQAAVDYRIDPGDSMEVRFSADLSGKSEYLIDVGDVIGVSFLDNWQFNVTRTVRSDGKITVPEVGDVQAAGKTASQLRDTLKADYAKTGILQEQPKITVNVDFVNVDRYENMSRNVTVRPDGAITIPSLGSALKVAGLTLAQAAELIKTEAAKTLKSPPVVSINILPAVNNLLNDMKGPLVVQPDGQVSVPKVGLVQAAGLNVDEFTKKLAEACKGLGYNPIEPVINLTRASGARFYVGGEVKMPGVYPLDATPTVLQALIMAQGLTNNSRMKSIMIIRRNPQGSPFVIKTNLRAAVSKGFTTNDIPLRAFDIVFVPQKFIAKADIFMDQYFTQLIPINKSMGINAQYFANTQKVDSKSRNFGFNTGVTGIADVLNPTGAIVK